MCEPHFYVDEEHAGVQDARSSECFILFAPFSHFLQVHFQTCILFTLLSNRLKRSTHNRIYVSWYLRHIIVLLLFQNGFKTLLCFQQEGLPL